MRRSLLAVLGCIVLPVAGSVAEARGHLDTGDLPARLRDRGEGIPLSMFGTYIQPGRLIVYPFLEFYRDANYEYAPNELGYGRDTDYRGDYEASEQLLFIAYGVSDRLAVELEAAIIQAELERSPEDDSGLPEETSASGVGDVEGQLRWRWSEESEGSPEIFSYFETVVPTQSEGSLIGTTDWEFKLGSGLVRGYSWGTVSVRAAVEYDRAEDAFDVGEIALEYLRRLSSSWRVYAGFEGTQDEVEFISEGQWHLSPDVFLKLNSAFGVTSKATDWAPELGIVFTF